MASPPRLLSLSRPVQPTFLLCDVQERFRPLIRAYPSVIHASSTLCRASVALSAPLLATEQYTKAFGRTVPELQPFLATGAGTAPVFEKLKFSMLTEPVKTHLSTLPSSSSHPSSYVLFGIEAHVCVLQTALELLAGGKSVFIPVDAVSSQRWGDRAAALHTLSQAGAVLTTTESVLFAVLGGADHPSFKAVSKLVMEHNRAADAPGSGLRELDRLM
jgi:nicotinamidase-related amidase